MKLEDFESWLSNDRRPALVMAVLNVTPDSFSDGGAYQDAEQAAQSALQWAELGADWIDVGGESTRPGSQAVSETEQIRRVLPAIRAIRRQSPVLISVDTTRAAVAEAALDAGANLVNGISAGRDDPAMFPLLARRNVAIILMHMQGTPATMQQAPAYKDVTAEVSRFLLERREAAIAAGIDGRRLLFDPGFGFGKTLSHNLRLLADTKELASLGQPLVVGPSRKSFIGKITGETDPKRREFGTAAAVAWAVANGAATVRVHDVGPIVQVVRMIQAISAEKNREFVK